MGLWKPKEVAGRRRQFILQLRVYSPGCRRELERGTLSFWAMSWWNIWWHLSVWESSATPEFGFSLETKGGPQHLRKTASSGREECFWPKTSLGTCAGCRVCSQRHCLERNWGEEDAQSSDLETWPPGLSPHMPYLLYILERFTFPPWVFPGSSVSKDSASNAGDWVWSLAWEDPLEKEMATQSGILVY